MSALEHLVELQRQASLIPPPQTIDYVDHNASTSLFNPNYTYSFDKYSCIRGFYFAHLVCSYLIFLSGIAAMVTRCVPRAKRLHAWFGRVFVLSMFWATATSMLIHNTGLGVSTLVPFAAVAIALSLGWFIIVYYRAGVKRAAVARVQSRLAKGLNEPLQDALDAAVREHLESRTFRQRFISLKTAHGALFFMAWFNIAGRIFASNQSGDFTCNTYPVYKPIDTKDFKGAGKPLTIVSARNPRYYLQPWARVGGDANWGLIVIGGVLVLTFAVLAVAAFVGARRDARKIAERADDVVDVDDDSPASSSGVL